MPLPSHREGHREGLRRLHASRLPGWALPGEWPVAFPPLCHLDTFQTRGPRSRAGAGRSHRRCGRGPPGGCLRPRCWPARRVSGAAGGSGEGAAMPAAGTRGGRSCCSPGKAWGAARQQRAPDPAHGSGAQQQGHGESTQGAGVARGGRPQQTRRDGRSLAKLEGHTFLSRGIALPASQGMGIRGPP